MSKRYQVVVQARGQDDAVFDLEGPSARIGRDAANEIHLPSPYVSRLQASLMQRDDRLFLRAEGLNPTIVNDAEVQPAETIVLPHGDAIVMPGFTILIRAQDGGPTASDAEARRRFSVLVR